MFDGLTGLDWLVKNCKGQQIKEAKEARNCTFTFELLGSRNYFYALGSL